MAKNSSKILVVEDDQGWRETLEGILKDQGYHVFTASSYGIALSEFRRRAFDLVSIDLSLTPQDATNRDGALLLEDVIEKGLPAIIVSGYATTDEKRRALKELKAFYFFEKGNFDSEQYTQVVEEALAAGAPTRTEQEKQKAKKLLGANFRGEALF